MANDHSGNSHKQLGAIRVRSNVCLSQLDWQLVPGDALRAFNMHFGELTPLQREELMRYEPCSRCHRVIYEIREFGCDNYTCRQQGIPSEAQAARRRESRAMQREED